MLSSGMMSRREIRVGAMSAESCGRLWKRSSRGSGAIGTLRHIQARREGRCAEFPRRNLSLLPARISAMS